MKVVATIEARMNSSRLPGKVLLPAAGKPLLAHLVGRLRSVTGLNDIVLATTTNASDDQLEEFARGIGVNYYRGSEDDVMQRVIEAAQSVEADIIVEITGDCPIIDPQIVEQTIRMFHANKADYVSNAHMRSYPDGMDVQVYSLETLKKSKSMTTDQLDHEHVTLHIRNNPEVFSQLHLVSPPETYWPELGLTLDDERDYKLLKMIVEHFQLDDANFGCREVVQLLRARPEWVSINKEVLRKGDT